MIAVGLVEQPEDGELGLAAGVVGAQVLLTRDVPAGSKVTAKPELEIRPRGGSASRSA
ncbi:MAG: hypothetical protein ABI689_11450 [Thermoanaerobaculia bacterium]